jgi:hypothetical protein
VTIFLMNIEGTLLRNFPFLLFDQARLPKRFSRGLALMPLLRIRLMFGCETGNGR